MLNRVVLKNTVPGMFVIGSSSGNNPPPSYNDILAEIRGRLDLGEATEIQLFRSGDNAPLEGVEVRNLPGITGAESWSCNLVVTSGE
eukprot:6310374-Amphidinium_carterae.1